MNHFLRSALIGALLLLPQWATLQEPSSQTYITRAEAVAILLLSRNEGMAQILSQGITQDQWYEPFLSQAVELGLIEPDAHTGELRPNEWLNRADLLKMLAKNFTLAEGGRGSFQDIPADAWYARYTANARRFALFPEDPDALNLHPDRLVTFHETVLATAAVLHQRAPKGLQEPLITRVYTISGKVLYVVISEASLEVRFIAEPESQSNAPSPHVLNPSAQELRTDVLHRVNAIRTSAGLGPLRYEARLHASAQRYAEDMTNRRFFSHVSPSGETFKQRVEAVGYYDRSFSAECFCIKGFSVAENLARGQKTAQAAVEAWMASPKHRAAILTPEYRDTGIGMVTKSSIWVQHFGGIILPGQSEVVGLAN